MTRPQSTIPELIVPITFEVSQLPDHLKHLDCYFWIQRRHVMIDCNGTNSPISVFCSEDGQLSCSCLEAREQGTCKHQQALKNGLWARLADCRRSALLTCTEDWCRPRSPYALSLAVQPRGAALETAGR